MMSSLPKKLHAGSAATTSASTAKRAAGSQRRDPSDTKKRFNIKEMESPIDLTVIPQRPRLSNAGAATWPRHYGDRLAFGRDCGGGRGTTGIRGAAGRAGGHAAPPQAA